MTKKNLIQLVNHHGERGPEERLQDAWNSRVSTAEDDMEMLTPVQDLMSPDMSTPCLPAWPCQLAELKAAERLLCGIL